MKRKIPRTRPTVGHTVCEAGAFTKSGGKEKRQNINETIMMPVGTSNKFNKEIHDIID